MNTCTPLYGYDSQENSFLVQDYPYGFKLRTSIKFWLERNTRGVRFCSCTLNPKTNKWNAPKASTYTDTAANMYQDEKGHVQWDSVGRYSRLEDLERFVSRFPKMHETDRLNLLAHVIVLKKMNERTSKGEHNFTLAGVPQLPSESEKETAQANSVRFESLLEMLKSIK